MVTTRQPTTTELDDAELAWRVCGWVKSNAIVLAKDGTAWGIGAGQQNRVESGELAATKAAGRAAGGACASDAFYPFPDGIEAAAAAGVAVIIQPGGSVQRRGQHRPRRRARRRDGPHRGAPLPPLTAGPGAAARRVGGRGEHERAAVGDHDRVLELCRQAAVGGAERPAVAALDGDVGARRQERLDGEDEALPQRDVVAMRSMLGMLGPSWSDAPTPWPHRLPITRNPWRRAQRSTARADAADRATGPGRVHGVGLGQRGWPRRAGGRPAPPTRMGHRGARPRVGPVAVELGGHVHVHEVAGPQAPRRRGHAVGRLVVDADAGGGGEADRELGCGAGAVAAQDAAARPRRGRPWSHRVRRRPASRRGPPPRPDRLAVRPCEVVVAVDGHAPTLPAPCASVGRRVQRTSAAGRWAPGGWVPRPAPSAGRGRPGATARAPAVRWGTRRRSPSGPRRRAGPGARRRSRRPSRG